MKQNVILEKRKHLLVLKLFVFKTSLSFKIICIYFHLQQHLVYKSTYNADSIIFKCQCCADILKSNQLNV